MLGVFQLLGSVVLAVGAGLSFVVQQAVNANLRASLGSPSWAAFISYFGGTLTMALVLLALREPWISSAGAARASWLSWSGGVFGAVYIVISILLLPRLGAATFIALLVAGQMLASIAFDHYGLFGIARHPADLSRVIGALLLVAGVILVRM